MTSQVRRIVPVFRVIRCDGENVEKVYSIHGLSGYRYRSKLIIGCGFIEERNNKGDWNMNERGNTIEICEAEFNKNFEQHPESTETQRVRCICGKEYGIERNSKLTTRTDGKRIFPIGHDEPGLCCFVCRDCDSDLAEVLPGAQYE